MRSAIKQSPVLRDLPNSSTPSESLLLTHADLAPYQQWAIDRGYDYDATIFRLWMGAGKTVISACIATELLYSKHIQRYLVLAPKRVATLTWPEEFTKWTFLVMAKRAFATGSQEERLAAFNSDAQIVVMNYENLQWAHENKLLDTFDGIIYDEITRLKSAKGKRFKAISKYRFKHRIGLTGTFASEGLEEVYAPIFLMDYGARLGRSYTSFFNLFFESTGPNPWQYRTRQHAADNVGRAIAGLIYDIDDAEYKAQLPPLVTVPIPCAMSPITCARYKDIEKDLYDSETDMIIANDGVKTQKLQQITNGFLYLEDGSYEVLDDGKIEAYKEILEDNADTNFIVAYRYKADLERLRQIQEGPALGEGVSDKEAKQAYTDWNEGKLRVLYLHPRSAGHGLNLQAGGNKLIWFGLTWSNDEWEQTIARLRRRNQPEDQVFNYVLYAPDTVDVDVLEAHRQKKDVQAALDKGIRSRHGKADLEKRDK